MSYGLYDDDPYYLTKEDELKLDLTDAVNKLSAAEDKLDELQAEIGSMSVELVAQDERIHELEDTLRYVSVQAGFVPPAIIRAKCREALINEANPCPTTQPTLL